MEALESLRNESTNHEMLLANQKKLIDQMRQNITAIKNTHFFWI